MTAQSAYQTARQLRGPDPSDADQGTGEARFNCAKWPDCPCPDGAVAIDCPALANPDAVRETEVSFLPCGRWPDCDAKSKHCNPSCHNRLGRRESPLPEGAFAIICFTAACTAISFFALAGISAAIFGALQ